MQTADATCQTDDIWFSCQYFDVSLCQPLSAAHKTQIEELSSKAMQAAVATMLTLYGYTG